MKISIFLYSVLLCLFILFFKMNAFSFGKYYSYIKNNTKPVTFSINRTSIKIEILTRSVLLPKIKNYAVINNVIPNFNGSELQYLPIERLVLKNNQMTSLETEFIYFKELRFLDLSVNKLSNFIVNTNPPEKVSSKLTTIWLTNNQIQTIANLANFPNLPFDFMEFIDLTSNDLSCYCEANGWISGTKWALILNGNCMAPPMMIGKPITECMQNVVQNEGSQVWKTGTNYVKQFLKTFISF